MARTPATSQTAVWYFVAATFIFAAPALFFADSRSMWTAIGSLVIGSAVFAIGVVTFVREQRSRANSGREPRAAHHQDRSEVADD